MKIKIKTKEKENLSQTFWNRVDGFITNQGEKIIFIDGFFLCFDSKDLLIKVGRNNMPLGATIEDFLQSFWGQSYQVIKILPKVIISIEEAGS